MTEGINRLAIRQPGLGKVLRLAATLALLAGLFLTANWAFAYTRNEDAPKLLVMLVAITTGVGGAWLLFWLADSFVARLPQRELRKMLQPFVFVGPALVLLSVFLIYPTLRTIHLSLLDTRANEFVGIANYLQLLSNPEMWIAFRNNLIWLVTATAGSVSLGLLIAVLVDRIKFEPVAKSFIFLPVAISSVGASVIWRFMYAFQPAGRPQIGLLNALVVTLGGDPKGWMTVMPWNNFALIAIFIWLQTGFCMVVLSAAIKNVPTDLMEAARIDGANEFQLFFRITIPYIRGTLLTITTTILIMVLKIFDIVYVMTRGHYDTEVIANRMYLEMFQFRNFSNGSALAVILFLAVVPAMIINVRNARRQRSIQ